ncbi:hypothetical protein BCU94_15485 [Shewanella sp. 10N.286.52.C2]|nr:hypothetical protein BCU94_15485 [Shewanella sp. 10N.286.52.C2]PMH87478.1 hypothetical protein BCU57_06970 [Shewanella sp. 10N.286.48.B5]
MLSFSRVAIMSTDAFSQHFSKLKDPGGEFGLHEAYNVKHVACGNNKEGEYSSETKDSSYEYRLF